MLKQPSRQDWRKVPAPKQRPSPQLGLFDADDFVDQVGPLFTMNGLLVVVDLEQSDDKELVVAHLPHSPEYPWHPIPCGALEAVLWTGQCEYCSELQRNLPCVTLIFKPEFESLLDTFDRLLKQSNGSYTIYRRPDPNPEHWLMYEEIDSLEDEAESNGGFRYQLAEID